MFKNSNFFQNSMIDVVESYDEQCDTDVIFQSPWLGHMIKIAPASNGTYNLVIKHVP